MGKTKHFFLQSSTMIWILFTIMPVFTLVNMKIEHGNTEKENISNKAAAEGVTGYQSFVYHISTEIEKTKGTENFIFSPYSIHKAFSVLMLGSKENTRKELAEALSLTIENEKIVKEYEGLTETLKSSSSAILRDHNEIAVRKGFSLKKDFVTLVKAIVQIKNYNFDEPKETVK